MGRFGSDDPVGAEFRRAIGDRLAEFVDRRCESLAEVGAETAALAELASAFTAGGKRLRPAFCWWGHVAVADPDDDDAVLRACASLDLLHVSALVHDDVMDASDTRRGQPAVHRHLEEMHRAQGMAGAADAFGRAGAILLGDLLLVWSMELFTASGLPAGTLLRASPLLDELRTEVTGGQFLDVFAQAQPLGSVDLAAVVPRVVEYKTSRYTVIRPLQVGAAIAGGNPDQLAALAGFGSPLGRAFQYRDDVLGMFGEPEVTGKPAGDDLREGKRTVLIAHAVDRASASARQRLTELLGRPDLSAEQVDQARQIIVESGALAATEARIAADQAAALAALTTAPLRPVAVTALTRLAELSVTRNA